MPTDSGSRVSVTLEIKFRNQQNIYNSISNKFNNVVKFKDKFNQLLSLFVGDGGLGEFCFVCTDSKCPCNAILFRFENA